VARRARLARVTEVYTVTSTDDVRACASIPFGFSTGFVSRAVIN
jgi:hypothetical protein